MEAPISYKIKGQQLWLSAQRALFWEEKKSLVVSDLHFGKTGHFRKSGIPVPQGLYKEDLQRLVSLLNFFQPKQLIVVGDFFHSHANTELDWFRKWRNDFDHVGMVLVKGNHDILQEKWYRESAIELVEDTLELDPFLFVHDRCETRPEQYTFCGHIHPGIVLQGLGKQSLRFPCFYFTPDHCILPAFSKFTGAVGMDQRAAEKIFAIVENKLMAI